MKLLTLIRHAKSSWKEPGMEDVLRPLNGRGKRDAVTMGQRLASRGFMPDLLLSSPAKRARATAKRIASEIGYQKGHLGIEDGIYHATSEQLLRIVARQDDSLDHVALAGHNPGFSEFSSYLCREFTGNMPTCGIVRLQLAVSSWQEVSRRCGALLEFDYPKRETDGEG